MLAGQLPGSDELTDARCALSRALAPSFRRLDKNRDNASNRVLRSTMTYRSELFASDESCFKYNIRDAMPSICYDDDLREREKTVGGIAVTVSMPHRFPYGSILFSVTHAPSSSILSIDRYCCIEFYEAHCVLIARGLIGGSRDIKSNDSLRSKRGPRLFACYPSTSRSSIRTSIANILSRRST